jgi:hypothetical protein
MKLFFIVSVLMFVLVILVGITSQATYTFLSRADEGPQPVSIASVSLPVQSVESSLLAPCVQFMNYLPITADSTMACYAQFECEGDVVDEVVDGKECSLQGKLVSCDKANACIPIKEWLMQAAEICGC